MRDLYEGAIKVAEELKVARLEVAKLSMELERTEYQSNVVKAKIERGLIKKVGDEKKLGSSLDSRERIFVLARDADQEYLSLYKQMEGMRYKLETVKIEVKCLQDKLTIMLTAMKAEDNG